MAICYKCDQQFYGYECQKCGWEAQYKCWNCKNDIIPKEIINTCITCKWYTCQKCGECGCSHERPQSREEKRKQERELY